MKRLSLAALAALAALPLFAQPANPGDKPVAVINGETITAAKLDQLWDRLGTQMRSQYEQAGGKQAFLQNYVSKRLLIQEAIKRGFDQRADVKADMQASAESTLFDRYVRDVVAEPIVTEGEIRAYYDEHPKEFETPEKVKIRHIVIVPTNNGPNPKTKEEAMRQIQSVAAELHQANTFPTGTDPEAAKRLVLTHFIDAAKKYSEDGARESGGDLGWVSKGVLDPTFEEAAFSMKPGIVSGVIETRFGYHLILVEARKPTGTEPFESAKPHIREYLMTQKAAQVVDAVKRLTQQLELNSKLAFFPENIK